MPDEPRTVRRRLARSAAAACACSVAWAALAGVAAVTAGTITGSVALLAFGLDSVIDGSASGVLAWRFRREARGAESAADAERRTARAVAAAMLAAAVYVMTQAGWSLASAARPRQGALGIVLLAGSAAVLPVLGRVKLRLARRLGSPALRGDGVLSAAGAILAAAALAGLAADRTLGWWQADPAAAAVIALFLLREGWRTLAPPGPGPAAAGPAPAPAQPRPDHR